jgi:hypothetical protein
MEQARRAFNWFLGENQLRQPLYDVTTGGCHDGLHADRVNENQGAESTLSFLLALSQMQSADGTPGIKPPEGFYPDFQPNPAEALAESSILSPKPGRPAAKEKVK